MGRVVSVVKNEIYELEQEQEQQTFDNFLVHLGHIPTLKMI